MNDDETKRRGRPFTGRVAKTRDGRWQAIVKLADGSYMRIDPPFPLGTSKAYAKERSKFWTERAQRERIEPVEPETAAPLAPSESSDPWFAAWLADRVARGFTATRDNAGYWRLHIAPVFGDRHPRDWTADMFRALSHELDRKVQSKALSWKTAVNIWNTATKMAADAANSKRNEIRCRADDPSAGVRGPDRGADLDLQFLYPSDFSQFVTCEKVPLRWRRAVAVAVYTYLRDAELRALAPDAADVEHSVLSVTQAWDRRSRQLKATKGRRRRHVPIEPAAAPLLAALRVEAEAAGRTTLLAELPSERDMAHGLRRWLKRADVTRRELHETTPTSRPIRFHDLRSTGITWMAVRGDDALKIQRRAGHRELETTERYIRLAEAVRGEAFGDVFPALPTELYERSDDGERDDFRSRILITPSQVVEIRRGGRDSNPRPPA
jgi:integrase